MEHLRNWLLPVLLGAGYVALSPFFAGLLGVEQSRPAFVAGAASTVVAAAALGFRRRAPLATLAVVTVVTVPGLLATGPDGPVMLPAELVALYSVAARCPPALSWRASAALAVVMAAVNLALFGPEPDFVWETGATVLMYGAVVGFGQSRRRRVTAEAAAAEELRVADEHRRTAAGVERRRLARELHDVSAHHLTSIVVSSGAAQRLTDRQPDLAGEALTFAARTGHQTLAALQQLVAVLETGESDRVEPPTGRITELARAVTRMGQQVRVEVVPELAGPAAEAAFAIVRESLTNTLRYAPGASVRVVVRKDGDRFLLTVQDGGSAVSAPPGQGSGRGIAGMRERAEAVGGRLTAGPGPDGGWQVEAELPADGGLTTPGRRHQTAQRRDRWLTAFGLTLAVVAAPAVGVAAALEEEPPGEFAVVASLTLLLSLLPGLALLGRRNRPWAALAGVIAAAWLWPVGTALGLLPASFGPALLLSAGAPAAAVYAVGAYAGPPRVTWWSVPVAAGGFGGAVSVFMALTPPAGQPFGPGTAVLVAVLVAVLIAACAAVPLAGFWGTGLAVRRSRDRRRGGGDAALADLVRAAEAAVRAERQRIAAGLHQRVLARTTMMIAVAEAGRLEDVTAEARSALTAMRELLSTLHEEGADAPRTPQLSHEKPLG